MKKIEVDGQRLPNFKGEDPKYETLKSAGMDVRAQLHNVNEFGLIRLFPGKRYTFPTGLAFAIPDDYEIQVRARSGRAHREGLTVLNAPGTIDGDYRGEIGVILINTGEHIVTIADQDRIAQLVLAPVYQMDINWKDSLDETERGTGGFGSTGQ